MNADTLRALTDMTDPLASGWLSTHALVTDEALAALTAYALSQALTPREDTPTRAAHHTRRRVGQVCPELDDEDTAILTCIVLSAAACLVDRGRPGPEATALAMELFGRAADLAPDYYDTHQPQVQAMLRCADALRPYLPDIQASAGEEAPAMPAAVSGSWVESVEQRLKSLESTPRININAQQVAMNNAYSYPNPNI